MNPKPLKQAKTKDFQYVQAALERAAKRAREIAKQTNTPLVIQQNGQMVKLKVE